MIDCFEFRAISMLLLRERHEGEGGMVGEGKRDVSQLNFYIPRTAVAIPKAAVAMVSPKCFLSAVDNHIFSPRASSPFGTSYANIARHALHPRIMSCKIPGARSKLFSGDYA